MAFPLKDLHGYQWLPALAYACRFGNSAEDRIEGDSYTAYACCGGVCWWLEKKSCREDVCGRQGDPIITWHYAAVQWMLPLEELLPMNATNSNKPRGSPTSSLRHAL